MSGQTGEVRLVAICDPHLSAYRPPAWKVDFLEETEATLRQVFKFAQKQEAHAILWAGDFFNLKAPHRNPTWFITRCIRLLNEVGIPHVGIAGNHDVKFGSLAGLSGMPLELLVETKVFNLVSPTKRWVIEQDGFTVHVTGDSFEHGSAESIMEIKREGADKVVALGHFWFGNATGKMFGEPMYGPDSLQSAEVDVFVIGHHHEDQGVRQINGKWYVSPGSINRIGVHKSDLTRKPAATYIRLTKTEIEIKVLRPKVQPVADLIDLAKREQIQQERVEIDQFIAALGTVSMETKDPREVLKRLTMPDAVREKVQHYLELAETNA